MYIDTVKAVGPNSLIEYYPGNELIPPTVYGEVNELEATEISALQYTNNGLLFSTSTAGVNLLCPGLSDAFNNAEGAISFFAKPGNIGIWTDATLRWLIHFFIDANNYIRIIRPTNDSCLQFAYKTASQNLVRVIDVSFRDEFHLGMSWSKSNGELNFYVNGERDATNFTLTSEISGSLTYATLGTETDYGRNSWAGLIRDLALYNDPLDSEKFKVLSIRDK